MQRDYSDVVAASLLSGALGKHGRQSAVATDRAPWLHLGITTADRAEVSLRGTTESAFSIGFVHSIALVGPRPLPAKRQKNLSNCNRPANFYPMLAPTSIKDALQSTAPAPAIQVRGWVRTRRDSKDFSFIELNDGSCLRSLQIIAKNTLPNYRGGSPHCHGRFHCSPGCAGRVAGERTELGSGGR